MTYLGNALVHTVALDWMTIEVRAENRADVAHAAIGDAVSVSWNPEAVSVVTD